VALGATALFVFGGPFLPRIGDVPAPLPDETEEPAPMQVAVPTEVEPASAEPPAVPEDRDVAETPPEEAAPEPRAVVDATPSEPVEPLPDVYVVVNTIPWGTWTLSGDGNGSGDTPLKRHLTPGSYTVRLVAAGSGEVKELPLVVEGDEGEINRCWNFDTDGPC